MTDPEAEQPCSVSIIAAPWRFTAGGVVLDPSTVVPFGTAIDAMLGALLAQIIDNGHRPVGKPKVMVRTRDAAEADPELTALTAYGQVLPLFPRVGHTWLVAVVGVTCAPLTCEPTC